MRFKNFLTEIKKEKILPIDKIALILFKEKAGIVKDTKRDSTEVFIGVANTVSLIKGFNDKNLRLTFDNSTDSGEFEIDSLVPLKILKGSDIDKKIRRLIKIHEIKSKKKIGYIVKGEGTYVRELHLGKKIGDSTVAFIEAIVELFQAAVSPSTEKDAKDKTVPVKKATVSKLHPEHPKKDSLSHKESSLPPKKEEKLNGN